MKKYKVQIADQALQDMQEIYQYISKNLPAPENAMNQYDRIAKAIQSLSTFPKRMRILNPNQNNQI